MLMQAPSGGDTFTGISGFLYAAASGANLEVGPSDVRQGLQRNWTEIPYPSSAPGSGVVQDGLTNSYSALLGYLSVLGSGLARFSVTGTLLIGSSLTFPANLQLDFSGAGQIKPGANATITISGPINAGAWKIFDLSNSNALIRGTPDNPFCYDEWFGAKADGVTDCTAAMNATRAFAHAAGNMPINQMLGTYLITGTVYGVGSASNSDYAPSCYGAGLKLTYWSYAGVANGLKFVGGSGLRHNCVYSGISFKGDASSIGVTWAGVVGYRLLLCGFEDNLVGVRFYNESTGMFTEVCQAQDCDFRSNCLSAAEYKVGAGQDSFNLSGLNNRCTINIPNGGTAILIGAGCKVYNAPLDVQFWGNGGASTFIANSATGKPCTMSGEVSYEVNSGSCALGTGSTINFIGNVYGTSDTVTAGTFRRSSVAQIFSDSSVLQGGEQQANTGPITTGANTIATADKTRNRLVFFQMRDGNIDVRYLFMVVHNGYGSAGYVGILWSTSIANSYGTITPSVDTSGNLIITGAGLPASGVTYVAYEMAIDPGNLPGTKHLQI
jgi:hypothetical protein